MSAVMPERSIGAVAVGAFVLAQVAVMALAISNESLWIDEFWTAHFAALGSLRELIDLVLVPSGSQTPLHFGYYYLWGQWFEPTELALRLANLPLFVAGQLALFWALRAYPPVFSAALLAISALHPMVWQYANEARPYIMIYAGVQMMLAYLLHLHARQRMGKTPSPLFSAVFVIGGIVLFGASLLGAFWVFSACVVAAWLHHRHLDWRYLRRGLHPLLIGMFLLVVSVLFVYYTQSVLRGAGGSRVSTTSVASLMFAAYELLGLSGLGPGRSDLRTAGLAALVPYAPWLAVGTAVIVFTLFSGLREALRRLEGRDLAVIAVLAAFPIVVVVASGFLMHWRVLGRHLMATLPIVNLLLALGVARWVERRADGRRDRRWILAAVFLLVLAGSAMSMRFAEQHRKDDYRTAAAIALAGVAQGQRVWWAADYVGANYYRLPGRFDYMGELTGVHQPPSCVDLPGVQATANLSAACMAGLSLPDVVVFSRPETFDKSGELTAYLQAHGFVRAQVLPVIDIWRRQEAAQADPAR
jgi:hypothetical protein